MSDSPPVVVVKDLYKSFKLPHEQHSGIKELLVNFANRKKGYEVQHVLDDLSFEIKQGEFFGIVGRNGSGKSTLLKTLAGIYVPDKGLVQVNGSLTPFIELGVGFNPELTGRENVFLNGALLGFSRSEMETMYDDIVSFAELERFMDQKLKNYSSGMQVRLAFSIAIRAESDVLLLDEVLAVGDAVFQQKCFKYFKELKKNKKTVILVSHDSNILQEYCTSGILLDKGEIVSSGSIKTVVKDYITLLNASEDQQDNPKEKANEWGNGEAEVVDCKVSNTSNEEHKVFTGDDENIVINVTYRAKDKVMNPVYGIVITDSAGVSIFESNTLWTDTSTEELISGEAANVSWLVPNIFSNGEFAISPAVANRDGTVIYNWKDNLASFKIRKVQPSGAAFTNIKHSITITRKTI